MCVHSSTLCTCYLSVNIQGIARTQSPTNKNYAPELPTFGAIDGVSPTGVQWKGLVHGEPPYGSRYPLCQVSMLGQRSARPWATLSGKMGGHLWLWKAVVTLHAGTRRLRGRAAQARQSPGFLLCMCVVVFPTARQGRQRSRGPGLRKAQRK